MDNQYLTFSQSFQNKTKPKITKTKKPNLQPHNAAFFLARAEVRANKVSERQSMHGGDETAEIDCGAV